MQQLKTRKPLRTSSIAAATAVQAEVKTTVYSPSPVSADCDPQEIEKPRLQVGPLDANGEMIDITHDVVEVVAREIWKRSQGNDLLNWIEAERLLSEALLRRARPGPSITTTLRHGR